MTTSGDEQELKAIASREAARLAYEDTAQAAHHTIERAGKAARALAGSGHDALSAEAQHRPVALALAALALGFILGRAL